MKVCISTYGTVNEEVGWSYKEVQLEQEKGTVEDVLRMIQLRDGTKLFNLVADTNGTKDNYTILLNGHRLWDRQDIKMEIKSGDLIAVMDFLYPIGGG